MWSWTSSGSRVPSKRRSRPLLLVVVDQRLGLLVVRREPLLDRLRACRPCAGSAAAVRVAHALVLGRVERRRGRCGRSSTARRPDRRSTTTSSGASTHSAAVSRRPDLLELLVQRVGLRVVAREAVEQEAVVALALDLARGSSRSPASIGHELAGVHVLLRLLAELGLLLDVLRAGGRRWRCTAGRSPCAGGPACVPLPAPGGPSRIRLSSDTECGQAYFRKPS